MIGFNGGLIGGFRDTTTGATSAPGVWTANEQVVAQRRGRWVEANDPFFSNVSLLLPGDGTNGSTSIIDRSPSPKTITVVGNAQISTAQSKFGGSSIAFDGSGDFLQLNGAASLGFETADFTLESWVRLASVSAELCFIDFRPTNTNGDYLIVGFRPSGVLEVNVNNVAIYNQPHGIPVNTWAHVAIARQSNNLRVFINGIQIGATIANTTNYIVGASRPVIGTLGYNTTLNNFNGFMDDLRITKGVARYTANFTPPTSPHPLF